MSALGLPARIAALLTPVRSDATELLDGIVVDQALLAQNLADMARANRWLGGAWSIRRALRHLLPELHPAERLVMFEVASGSGDLAAMLVRWATRNGFSAFVAASDINAQVIRIAAMQHQASTLRLLAADGRHLPLSDHSVDVVICTLALHHLAPADAEQLLGELRRVVRRGVILDDLVRSWPGYVGAWIFSHLTSRNPLTRHDGPLSALRAYTAAEVSQIARRAGLGAPCFRMSLGYRVTFAFATPPPIAPI